jgi:hypothetical protein
MALTLVLISNAVSADEWVTLRKPPEPGESAPAGILVDAASIEILATGIRRARVKFNFLGRRSDLEKSPNIVSFMIIVRSYDCEKQMTHDESMETHHTDDSVHSLDLSKSPKWYPAPPNRAADPTIDFVCGWKPK